MINVLYICTDWYEVGGSTGSLLNLIHSVKDSVYPIVLLSHEGKVKDEFDKRGIETIVCPFFYLWTEKKSVLTALHHPTRTAFYHFLTDDKRCARYVYGKLKDRNIELVHSNSSVHTVGATIAKILGVKHVWHIRENTCALLKHVYMGRARIKRMIYHADHSVFISHAVMVSWGISSLKTSVIWDAIFEQSFPLLSERSPYVLFCAATLNDFKGADVAVRVFCESGVAKDGYHLQMVGNCSDEYHLVLDNIARSYGMSDAIEYIGFSNRIEDYFCAASAFLMCSKFEGLGRVTIQAMAHGCPVIARNSGGSTDFVRHGETGYLFDTEQECAKIIRQVLSVDQSLIIQNAWDMVNREFTEQVYGKKIMYLYKNLLK